MSNKTNAVITGASGFIGTRLVQHLARIDRFSGVLALDIEPPRTRIDNVEYHSLDVREPIPPEIGRNASVIYNLAAVHRTPGHPFHEYYDTNVLGALNVVALAEACHVPTIVFTSSISVYGPSEALITETSPLQPVSAYGRSKRLAEVVHEHWVQRSDERRLVVVRPGVVFGPGERGNYTNLARALRRGYFVYPGRRDAVKSGGYVDELVATLDFALAQEDRQIVFNYAYPDLNTTEDIVRAFAQAAGFRSAYPQLPAWLLLAAAMPFEAASKMGLRSPIHRERVLKLVQSTKIYPGWLTDRNYRFSTNLQSALEHWRDETGGEFE